MNMYRHFTHYIHERRRTRLFGATALLTTTIIVLAQFIAPATATTHAQTSPALATPSYGCTSPSDCLSKMTLAEKEGQMTQVENNAFSQRGNSVTDIKTYFIGSVLSGGGGGPNGTSGGTASQWADMTDNFQNYALQTRLGIPLIYGADAVHGHNNVYGATL
ncbi:MAG TPA: glycoside hydrolase family 3 N-terminal domain-containing protein, partial [Ktedonobacterales bacterium]|nr:glycoside hydrolase family 3 N-terminal domain-containing protein [Ktedonobacterales bacterium]